MYNAEIKQIEIDFNEFISINKDRYDILCDFQENLLYLNEETYHEILEFIKFNKAFFFKDHSNSVLFFRLIKSFSKQYFKKMEIFLDIIVYFSKEIKKNLSDSELISKYIDRITLFYLFSKNYFTIDSIVLSFYSSKHCFIEFFPEIETNSTHIGRLSPISFKDIPFYYDEIKTNPEKYILYRNMCHHPSRLHKCIRDDDIDTFQSILSLNNYDVNYQIEFSYYDRTPILGKELPTLIEIAAVYGSINIFKFLWMQPQIEIGNFLLDYAFLGQNLDIIHICETKKEIVYQISGPFLMHHYPFMKYCYEICGSMYFESNPIFNEFFEYFFKHYDTYLNINFAYLNNLMVSYNYCGILNFLPLIAFIVKNLEAVEFPNQPIYKDISFLCDSIFDTEIFKFLFKQRKFDLDINQCDLYYKIMEECIYYGYDEVFKVIYDDLYESVDSFYLFKLSLSYNIEIAYYLLDIQFINNFIFNQLIFLVAFHWLGELSFLPRLSISFNVPFEQYSVIITGFDLLLKSRLLKPMNFKIDG